MRVTRPDHKIKYVRIVHNTGMLESRGAQSELARILNVSRQYVYYLRKVVRAEGIALEKTELRGKDGS